MTYQIAYVKTNTELTFRDYLKRHEIESYLPVTKIAVRPRGKRKPIVIERAVFPHYVFMPMRDGMDGIIRLFTGFLNWLQFGDDDICIIEEREIQLMKERETQGVYDKVSIAPGVVFQPGVKVRVLTGAFSGFEGRVVRGPKRKAIAQIEVCGKIIDIPIALLAIAL